MTDETKKEKKIRLTPKRRRRMRKELNEDRKKLTKLAYDIAFGKKDNAPKRDTSKFSNIEEERQKHPVQHLLRKPTLQMQFNMAGLSNKWANLNIDFLKGISPNFLQSIDLNLDNVIDLGEVRALLRFLGTADDGKLGVRSQKAYGERNFNNNGDMFRDRREAVESDEISNPFSALKAVFKTAGGPNRYWARENLKVLSGLNLGSWINQFDADSNGTLDTNEIKAMLKSVGVTADGKLGSASRKALENRMRSGNDKARANKKKLLAFENPLDRLRRLAREKKELEEALKTVSNALIEAGNIGFDKKYNDYEPYVLTKNEFYSRVGNDFERNLVAPIIGYYPDPEDSTGIRTYTRFIQQPARIDSTYLKLNDSTAVILSKLNSPRYYYEFYDPRNLGDSTDIPERYPYPANDLVIPVKTDKLVLDYARRFKENHLGLRGTYKGFKPDTTQVAIDSTRVPAAVDSTAVRPAPMDSTRRDTAAIDSARRLTARRDTTRIDSTKNRK